MGRVQGPHGKAGGKGLGQGGAEGMDTATRRPCAALSPWGPIFHPHFGCADGASPSGGGGRPSSSLGHSLTTQHPHACKHTPRTHVSLAFISRDRAGEEGLPVVVLVAWTRLLYHRLPKERQVKHQACPPPPPPTSSRNKTTRRAVGPTTTRRQGSSCGCRPTRAR